ncbi:hypothetical protein EVAR_98766_1 [Eumeta japonica]|uniref:Uncharacterized protein n=1 Tax=Eumeta variegata TaxID=151549 RepID=A0A4C1T5X2_EUMVA|nr:hypothetical protein EVAR_98766_1 [Eumeta japonica]
MVRGEPPVTVRRNDHVPHTTRDRSATVAAASGRWANVRWEYCNYIGRVSEHSREASEQASHQRAWSQLPMDIPTQESPVLF